MQELVTQREKNFRYRASFRKIGSSRFLTHLQLVKNLRGAFLNSGMPVTRNGSQGHPQIAFGPALPMNVESREEFLDFFTYDYLPVDNFLRRVNSILPLELCFLDVMQISRHTISLSAVINGADYSVRIPVDPNKIRSYVEIFQKQEEILFTKHKNEKVVNLKEFVRSIRYNEEAERLFIEMRIVEGSTVGIHNVLKTLFEDHEQLIITRERLYIWLNGEKRSPLTMEWEQMQIQKHLMDLTT